jgi:hypothetical protein
MRNSEFIHTYYGYSDAKSKSIVWNAYAEYFAAEEIMEEGFNINSGYIYLALEMGVTIASAFGQEVEYIVIDRETDEEMFFDSILSLQTYLEMVKQG